MHFEHPATLTGMLVPAYLALKDRAAAHIDANEPAPVFPDPDQAKLVEAINQRHTRFTRGAYYAGALLLATGVAWLSGPETTTSVHPGNVTMILNGDSGMYNNLPDGNPAILDAANGTANRVINSPDGFCTFVITDTSQPTGCVASNAKSESNIATVRDNFDMASNPLSSSSSQDANAVIYKTVQSAIFNSNGSNNIVIETTSPLSSIDAANLQTLESQVQQKTKNSSGQKKYAISAIVLGNGGNQIAAMQSYANVLGNSQVYAADSLAQVKQDTARLLKVNSVHGVNQPDRMPIYAGIGLSGILALDAFRRRLSGHHKRTIKE